VKHEVIYIQEASHVITPPPDLSPSSPLQYYLDLRANNRFCLANVISWLYSGHTKLGFF
jgi:hypothetical protein